MPVLASKTTNRYELIFVDHRSTHRLSNTEHCFSETMHNQRGRFIIFFELESKMQRLTATAVEVLMLRPSLLYSSLFKISLQEIEDEFYARFTHNSLIRIRYFRYQWTAGPRDLRRNLLLFGSNTWDTKMCGRSLFAVKQGVEQGRGRKRRLTQKRQEEARPLVCTTGYPRGG